MKRIFLLGMLAAFLVCGCKKNDDPVNPSNPDTPVADPEGTITANISETTHINVPEFGTIAWVNPNNFSLSSSNDNILVSICDKGAMKGLGNIVKIPETGYTVPTSDIITGVACQIGHGYVIKFERQQSTNPPVFVRLYVEETITNAFDEILGTKVKYQYPFEATMLTVSADSLSFPVNGGTKTLDITTDAADWTYSSNSWIEASREGNVLLVSVAPDVNNRTGNIIITANEKQHIVTVEVSSTMLTVSKEALNFPANGVTETVIVTTDATEWSYTCSDTWIQADQQGNRLSVTLAASNFILEQIGSITVRANEQTKTITVKQPQGITTEPPYNIGDIYAQDGVVGVVYQVSNGGYSGMIVSLNEMEGYFFQAQEWCLGFASSGWYMPSIGDLEALYAGFCGLSEYPGEQQNASVIYKAARDRFNATLSGNGGTPITEDWYWSSTEYSNYSHWGQSFSSGEQDSYYDDYDNRCRCVRNF
ncbi:MAG: hypothetical protein LBM67_00155 [Lentimicrobiaceae bacterium]|jgi:hypothetical protein|nr:hypothetical protein [Lentimicrobiaceae bacterium]